MLTVMLFSGTPEQKKPTKIVNHMHLEHVVHVATCTYIRLLQLSILGTFVTSNNAKAHCLELSLNLCQQKSIVQPIRPLMYMTCVLRGTAQS